MSKWRYDTENSVYEWEQQMQEDLFTKPEWPKQLVASTYLGREDLRTWAERESLGPEAIRRVRDGVGQINVVLEVSRYGDLKVLKIEIEGLEYTRNG